MRRCRLSGTTVESLPQLYRELSRQLGLPNHFGNNLDALWDVLTTDVAGPVEVIWEDAEASRRALGADFARVAALFEAVADARDDFRIVFR